MNNRITHALALAVALAATGVVTEADESTHGDQLVALANVRWQLLMDESMGVVDMYQEAAVRTGVSALTVNEYTRHTRQALRDQDETSRMREASVLGATVRGYLAGRVSRDQLSRILDFNPA